jgi:hypothetical protein
MARTVSIVDEKPNMRVSHQVEKVNLYEFGYEKAGTVKGDPDVYASYLDVIINGDLVEEPYKGFTEAEKKDRIKEIKSLEKEKKSIDAENEVIQKEIKEKEGKIEAHREELLKIHESRMENPEKLKTESFSPMKFSINLFILVFLTGYLFFFYVSAAFKALYVDFEAIAEGIAEGTGVGSIMPQSYELIEALKFNFLLVLVPFVFYAFGWAFHVLLELKGNVKFVYLSFLIGVTFVVDFLLAMIIHGNIESAKELMGLATEHWSSSSTFYIILSFGFLVYIVWSILLDSMLREWDKRQVIINIRKIIQHFQGDIKTLEAKLKDTRILQLQIKEYREDISTVMYGNLKKYIDQFTSGWITYLSPPNMKDVKESCLVIKKSFEDKYDIKTGIVKVVSKRG